MGYQIAFRVSRKKLLIAVILAAAVLVLGVGTALATVYVVHGSYSDFYNGLPFHCSITYTRDDVTGISKLVEVCTGPGIEAYCREVEGVQADELTYTEVCYSHSLDGCPEEGVSCRLAATSLSSSLWLSDVCQPYYGGMFDQYGQITFGTDSGTTLYVGASYDGSWTAVEANGPDWVLMMSDLDALAASMGVASSADLWFTTRVGNGGYAEPRLLSTMVMDRAAGWGDDCTVVDGGPVTSTP